MTGYDEDLALWLNERAAQLRARRFNERDIENLAQEVESIGAQPRARDRPSPRRNHGDAGAQRL